MNRTWFSTACILTGLCFAVTPALPQAFTMSAKPGVVNYLEGSTSLNGQSISSSDLRSSALNAGDVLSTESGKAEVLLTPDVERIAIHWRSSDPDRLAAMLRDGFDAHDEGASRWSVGTTMLVLHSGGGPVGPLRSRGFRYLTVQVFDVRAEHARLLELGWREGTAPIKLGETAFISFVLDPDGAPIEISQRASLTGPLPEV